MAKEICKYCGGVISTKYTKICGGCYTKLKLVRKMQKMIRDTVGISEGVKK